MSTPKDKQYVDMFTTDDARCSDSGLTNPKPIRPFEETLFVITELLSVVQEAGGCCSNFTWERLRNTSAAEFINNLSTNMDITFTKKVKRDE